MDNRVPVPVDGDELNGFSSGSSASPSGSQAVADGDGPQSLCLSASNTTMETVKFQHRWTIDQFSVQQELSQIGESLESSPFGTKDDNYKFRLKLFPCGKDEECRGYLSLFLQIQKCPQSKLRFRVNFYLDTTEGARGCALNRNVVIINKGGIVTASKFFSQDTLKSRAAVYVPGDVLTVGVDLTVFGEQTSKELDTRSQPRNVHELAPELGTLAHDMAAFYADLPATDCVLRVGSERIGVHTALLQARSPVFHAMFSHNTTELKNREVDIDDCTPAAMRALVQFIYTDKCARLDELAGDVLAAADKYGVLRLKQQCERQLCQDLSVDNVCERLRIADSYSAGLLRSKALTVVEQNRPQILNSPVGRWRKLEEWSELESACPLLAAVVLKELITSNGKSSSGESPVNRTVGFGACSTPASAQSAANVLLIRPQSCSGQCQRDAQRHKSTTTPHSKRPAHDSHSVDNRKRTKQH